MRPIDNLRSKVDFWKKATTDAILKATLYEVLKLIDEAIYHMDHQEDESPWHRVEDPPKEGQNVLTMDANEDMETATYDGEGFEDSYGFYVTDVLYWMPIQPPKEDA